MSGLAVVAHALGASVTGSDRAAGSPYGGPLKAAGIEPAIGHDAANVPDGRRGRLLERDPADQPRATTGRPRCTAPTCSASSPASSRRSRSPAPTARRRRRAWSSTRSGAESYLVGGEVRSTGVQRRLGDDEWLVVEADESDRSLLKLTPDDRGRDQRRARPPHDLRLPARRRRHVRAVPRASASSGSCPRTSPASPSDPTVVRRRSRRSRTTGSTFDFDGHDRHAPGPRRPQRRQRRRGADRDQARRRRRRTRRASPRQPSKAPAAASSVSAPRPRARWWSTTTPTTRPRSAPRSRPPARWSPAA